MKQALLVNHNNADSDSDSTQLFSSHVNNVISSTPEETVEFGIEDQRKALAIVRDFIKKKKRIIYGSTALDAYMKSIGKTIFEDKDVDQLPDYDFFSPDNDADTRYLADLFHKKEYKYVFRIQAVFWRALRVSAYVTELHALDSVADATFMHKRYYDSLPTTTIDGLQYPSPEYLKIDLYKGVTRPCHNLYRWKKDYRRMVLFEHHFPTAPPSEADLFQSMDTLDDGLESHNGFLGSALKLATETVNKIMKGPDSRSKLGKSPIHIWDGLIAYNLFIESLGSDALVYLQFRPFILDLYSVLPDKIIKSVHTALLGWQKTMKASGSKTKKAAKNVRIKVRTCNKVLDHFPKRTEIYFESDDDQYYKKFRPLLRVYHYDPKTEYINANGLVGSKSPVWPEYNWMMKSNYAHLIFDDAPELYRQIITTMREIRDAQLVKLNKNRIGTNKSLDFDFGSTNSATATMLYPSTAELCYAYQREFDQHRLVNRVAGLFPRYVPSKADKIQYPDPLTSEELEKLFEADNGQEIIDRPPPEPETAK